MIEYLYVTTVGDNTTRVVLRLPLLSSKLGKGCLYIDITTWYVFRVFSDKDIKTMGTTDPLLIGQ